MNETFAEEFVSHGHFVDLFFELEAALVFKADATSCHVGSHACLLCFLPCASVLVNNRGFGGQNEVILLLGLSFLHNLTDACVWIENWLQFHLLGF